LVTDDVQVTFLPERLVSEVARGTTIFVAAHWVDLPIDSTCGGVGSPNVRSNHVATAG